MLSINEQLEHLLKERFPNRSFGESYYAPGTWQSSRYIQILTPLNDKNIHYEYCIDSDWNGRIELHFEGEDWDPKYNQLIEELSDRTQYREDLIWSNWDCGYRCQFSKTINSFDELVAYLTVFMETFDNVLKEVTDKLSPPAPLVLETTDSINQQITIDVYTKNLREVMSLPLAIPNYQRIYCWDESNVKCLLDDVFSQLANNNGTPIQYRLGTIILHYNCSRYDIIDGQQRLITLSLLMNELGVYSKLLDEKIESKRSRDYIAYNKFLIKSYVQKNTQIIKNLSKRFLDCLEFSVLVLRNASLDMAYTFFSNQNSRGVELTDYDLLKAHHLRFIPQSSELQSMRAAQVWNTMIEEGRRQIQDFGQTYYSKTLDTYIYRLRKWMRKTDCLDESNNYRIKKEYEAAPIIDEIPPFGETFYFNEPIQGGSHFFSYVEQHLNKYKQFITTTEYLSLHQELQGGSHQLYRDAIESILFGYYLKFKSYYLTDALLVIMRIILQHRYKNKRAQKDSIVCYVRDSELILMIDQATSPTFFLAEARNVAKDLSYPQRKDMLPIQLNMRSKALALSHKLSNFVVSNSFKFLNR